MESMEAIVARKHASHYDLQRCLTPCPRCPSADLRDRLSADSSNRSCSCSKRRPHAYVISFPDCIVTMTSGLLSLFRIPDIVVVKLSGVNSPPPGCVFSSCTSLRDTAKIGISGIERAKGRGVLRRISRSRGRPDGRSSG